MPAIAAAQDYPTRTIRIISPVPAGGLSDVAMRPMALELQKRLGQPVVIENRAGANGMLAGRACAQAAPDGYTICNLFNDTVLNAPFLFKNVGYDPRKDFTTITNGYFITGGFLVAAVGDGEHAARADRAVEEHARRSQPRRAGHHHRDVHPQLQHRDRLELPDHSLQERQRGRERAADQLGAGGQQRRRQSRPADPGRQVQGDRASIRCNGWPLLPDIPTLKEFKLEHTRIKAWYGFMAPAGTPPAIVKKLHDEIVAIYSEPTMRQRALINAGLEPILNTPEEFARFLDVEWDRTARQMKIIGATPQ